MPSIVQTAIYSLRLKHTFRISRAASDAVDNVFVRLDRDGIVGYGEAAPIRRYAETAPETARLVNEIVRDLPEDLFDLQSFHELCTQRWGTRHAPARAALEMAILDWAGKALGAPLFRLWGPDPRRVPRTSFTIGLDSLDIVLRKLEEAEQYPILKVKLGGDQDLKIMEEIRKRTDRPIRVDANEGWDRAEALEKIRVLADFGVEFVEQPLPADDLEGARWLHERSPLPLMADESVHSTRDIPRLVGAYDGINIKLMKCGGLVVARDMIAVARAFDLKVMLGCMVESSLGIAAIAHLSPLVDYLDLDGNLLITNDPFAGLELTPEGKWTLPERPGIGVSPVKDIFGLRSREDAAAAAAM